MGLAPQLVDDDQRTRHRDAAVALGDDALHRRARLGGQRRREPEEEDQKTQAPRIPHIL
ncbi:MAG: hypothetical protein R2712_13155 [Vicinamibacterales bacterium]